MKITNKIVPLLMTITVFTAIHTTVFAQKITDTIFYNNDWQICEKSIAANYRIGTLAIDSFWFYTGKIKDYSIADTLLMEGAYTEDGYKTGLFKFYYPNGKLRLLGRYEDDKMKGAWQWYYQDGSVKAIIIFEGVDNNFEFLQYTTPDGKTTLQNGTGDFEWFTASENLKYAGDKVYGSFLEGKRSGTWSYSVPKPGKDDVLLFKEKYDDNGRYKKTITAVNYYGKQPKSSYAEYNFEPVSIAITEHMAYDNFFRKGGDSTGELALTRYLLNRKAAEIIVKDSTFENALLFIIHTLENNRNRLEYQEKDVDGNIEFKLGDKGYPEDITVTGKGITDKEKEFIIFLLSKFHNIEMPGSGSVAIEGYHTIYFYSINIKEFTPASMKDLVNNDLFFSTLPKDKLLVLMRSVKKKLKKYIREEYSFYW